jgi:uncharacterized membrane protein
MKAGGASQHAALDENVEVIRRWEQDALDHRSPIERLGDWLMVFAGSGPVLLGHVIWFAGWIVVNLGAIPGIEPFDALPFPFLTMTVSLEAIFLALLVLAGQNRLARQSDKRAQLDLQIDLLAEREMTAVLKLLQDIARQLDVKMSVTAEQIRELAEKTDLHRVTDKVEAMPDTGASEAAPQSRGRGASGACKEE